MQIFKQSGLEEPQSNTTVYCWFEIADNNITEKGCKHMSKAEWSQMEEIGLGISSLT